MHKYVSGAPRENGALESSELRPADQGRKERGRGSACGATPLVYQAWHAMA